MRLLKRSVSILLTLTMMLGILAVIPLQANAATDVSYIYRYWDSTNQRVVDSTKTCSDYSVIGSQKDLTIGNGKWYVVNGDASISNRVTVTGTANVILLSGTLTCKDGIRLSKGNTLNIYPGKSSEGTLTAKIRSSDNANIGGNENETCGKLNFYGGTLNTENDGIWTYGAAIGGGEKGGAGDLSFYGGKVNAKNTGSAVVKCSTGAAIGSGGYENNKAPTGSVNIYGGEIKAICSGYSTAAGIGGGEESKTPVINILGGKVTAKGSEGAGIGCGQDGASDTITIRNAEIDAESDFGAGIGSGEDSDSKSIIIEDSYVKAKTIHEGSSVGSEGAGIGGGNCGASKSIFIKGSIIIASSGTYGAGIGGGDESDGGDITIDNSIVFACSGKGGAGIGGGDEKGCNSITLRGSYVIALTNAEKNTVGDRILSDYKDYYDGLLYSSNPFLDGTDASYNAGFLLAQVVDSIIQGTHTGAAIGGGDSGTVNKIHIENCVVGAESGECAAAIGGGDNGGFGTIEIVNSNIVAVSGDYGAAIGSGDEAKKCGTITIKDSDVVAEAGTDAAGIGTGNEADESATINIIGSTITAHGGRYGAGIGGGDAVSGGTITITDSTIKEADSKTDGAGIGGGESGSGGTITIKNSSVTAHGGGYAAGIGGGDHANGGIITIDHSTVKAYGGTDAAGIGGGEDGDGGDIIIRNESDVYAEGKEYGAGIGGGEDAGVGQVRITGESRVEAVAGSVTYGGRAVAIGNGDYNSWFSSRPRIGTMWLGSDLQVKAGSDSGNTAYYSGNSRFNAIWSNRYAKIGPCEHRHTKCVPDVHEYPTRVHDLYCRDCGKLIPNTSEAHIWNDSYVCTKCNVSADLSHIRFVERDNSKEYTTKLERPEDTYYELPECTHVPDGYRFVCWKMDGYGVLPGDIDLAKGDFTAYALYLPVVNTTYIDEDGNEQTVQACKLNSSDLMLGNGFYLLDQNMESSDTMFILGDAKLIIADGVTYTSDTGGYNPPLDCDPYKPSSLTLYGQKKQTGTMDLSRTYYPVQLYHFIQYGAKVKGGYADFITYESMTIVSGTFEADAAYAQGISDLFGGNITIDRFDASHNIYLGSSGNDISVRINSIGYGEKHYKCVVSDGIILTDEENLYSGAQTRAQVDSMEGKTLKPYTSEDYELVKWNWSDYYNNATAVLRSKVSGAEKKVRAKVVYEDSGNNRKATARCTFLGQEYKTTQTFRIIFDVTVAKTQNGKVTANKQTAMFGDNIKLDVTPDDGYVLSEMYYTDSKGKKTVIEETGFTMPEGSVTVMAVFEAVAPEHTHTYGEPVWKWSNDHKATVTKKVENNKMVYTASVDMEGKTYTDTYSEAHTHTYSEDPVWKWSDDHQSAQLVFPCTADGCDEGIAVDAIIAPSEESGKLTLIAIVYYNNKLYTDTYIEDHVHTYSDPEWLWSDNLDSAKAKFFCTDPKCGFFELVDASVTTKAESGKIILTAAADFEGKTYTGKKEYAYSKVAGKEPYIDSKGEYIPGNVEYYVINGRNYSVNDDGTVVRELKDTSLSYFDFLLKDNTYTITHYTGSYDSLKNDELIIPKTFNGFKITGIGSGKLESGSEKDVFMKASGSKKQFVLMLNENITTIYSYAFYNAWVTKVAGDTSSLNMICRYAFSWANSPGSYSLDIRLDYPGGIGYSYGTFSNMNVTLRMKHSAWFIRKNDYARFDEQSIRYVFTDAHTYGEPVWDWDEDYIGATVNRTCTHPNCKHSESVLAEFIKATDEDGLPYTEAVAKFSDAVYHDVQPVYKTETGGYIVEVTGRFKGGVDSGKHNLVGTEGFRVVFKDKNGNKVDAPQYIWVAQESASDGIVVDPNGDVAFTKEGDFHVQITSPDGKTVYSPWITVRAYRGGDDGTDGQSFPVIDPKDDIPKTGDAAPTAIAVILLTSLSAALFLVVKRRRNEDEA